MGNPWESWRYKNIYSKRPLVWKIIEHAVKTTDRRIHAVTEIRRCDNTVFNSSLLKPRFTSDILFVCTSCLLTRLVRLHSIAVSLPDYCLYAIISVISPLCLPSPPPPPLPSMSPLNSHSDLWLLILYLSTRRTGAREMTCFRLGWKDTHTLTRTHSAQIAHTRASETASSSQCNYGETEQSVTHLSAARIRAGVLLWHWWGKPGVSLLKHNDRQLHLLTWPRWQTKYLDWAETEKDELWCRTWRWHCRTIHACERTNILYKCTWTKMSDRKDYTSLEQVLWLFQCSIGLTVCVCLAAYRDRGRLLLKLLCRSFFFPNEFFTVSVFSLMSHKEQFVLFKDTFSKKHTLNFT